jgi:signal transduction histidine kinase
MMAGLLAGRRPSARLAAQSVLGVVRQGQAYKNLAYAIAALPLGLCYTALIVAGAAAGVVLLPVLVGIPILAGTVAAWWWLGGVERRAGAWWLGVEAPPVVRPRAGAGPAWLRWWRHAAAYLGSYQTWMTLGYLLLKVPFGLLALVVAGGLAAGAVGMLIALVPLAVTVADGEMDPTMASAVAVFLVAVGCLAGVGSLHAANVMARLAAAMIRLLLGQGDAAQRLAAAAATAQREQGRADRAERSRQELIVNVGHELRTPTATIRGHVESLLLGLEGVTPPAADELRHHLGIVERETQRLGALIDELLMLARADAGELRLELAPVAAGEVIEEVYQSVATLARRERQVTLTRGVQRGLPTALADRQRLVQVLLNLVRNAVAYTPEGGIVAVTAERGDAGRVAFAVVDTGAGISSEDLPHVFERFYRADPSRTRTSGGFGLGLAIVRDLVKAMGGSVEVESQVGEGTRFRVLLPAAP